MNPHVKHRKLRWRFKDGSHVPVKDMTSKDLKETLEKLIFKFNGEKLLGGQMVKTWIIVLKNEVDYRKRFERKVSKLTEAFVAVVSNKSELRDKVKQNSPASSVVKEITATSIVKSNVKQS